jgi:hypothetical protein
MKNKIFAFIEQINAMGYIVTSVADDGNVLASHCSSSESYAKHDIGINSKWKHDLYDKHFPNGWEIEWVADPETHDGFKKACEANQKLATL